MNSKHLNEKRFYLLPHFYSMLSVIYTIPYATISMQQNCSFYLLKFIPKFCWLEKGKFHRQHSKNVNC